MGDSHPLFLIVVNEKNVTFKVVNKNYLVKYDPTPYTHIYTQYKKVKFREKLKIELTLYFYLSRYFDKQTSIFFSSGCVPLFHLEKRWNVPGTNIRLLRLEVRRLDDICNGIHCRLIHYLQTSVCRLILNPKLHAGRLNLNI